MMSSGALRTSSISSGLQIITLHFPSSGILNVCPWSLGILRTEDGIIVLVENTYFAVTLLNHRTGVEYEP